MHCVPRSAGEAQAGDCICLFGPVGAGKSAFSRAFIRAVADDAALAVPSPTFLLQLTYEDHSGPPVHHYDLYRLSGPDDLRGLDLQDSFTRGMLPHLQRSILCRHWTRRPLRSALRSALRKLLGTNRSNGHSNSSWGRQHLASFRTPQQIRI